MRNLIVFMVGLMLFAACGEDTFITPQEQLEIDRQIIMDYLAANNIDAIEDPSGLFYLIEEEGTGIDYPTATSNFIANYKGYFPDGEVFDQGDNFSASLRSMILGWQIGIPKFKKGGKGKLFIPSGFGYGRNGSRNIPPNQVIFFDVELINFD